MNVKFFKCLNCGNVVMKVVDHSVPVFCCGARMTELKPNTVDASNEKHVPVVTRIDDNTIEVKVGSAPHPMTLEHHIDFIYVVTENSGIRVDLTDEPSAVITVGPHKVLSVYEYCNLHGLWMTEL
ncbi:MAG: desulfoferrodoxin family protein [Muribaculaceae bacterium]